MLFAVHVEPEHIFLHDYVKFDPYLTSSSTFINDFSEFDKVEILQTWVMNVTKILDGLIPLSNWIEQHLTSS